MAGRRKKQKAKASLDIDVRCGDSGHRQQKAEITWQSLKNVYHRRKAMTHGRSQAVTAIAPMPYFLLATARSQKSKSAAS